jgi:hypothetical protein
MAKAADVKAMKPLSESFEANDEGWLDKLIADEDDPDRATLWRLGSWAIAAVVALTLGLLSGQVPDGAKRSDLAEAELASQAARIEDLTRETKQETRRIAAAVETLNSDRDRLFGRLTALEQNLDSVTGSIAKQAPPATATEHAADKVAERSMAPAPTTSETATSPASPPAPAVTAEAPKDVPARDPPKDTAKSASPAVTAVAAAQTAAPSENTARKADRSDGQRATAPPAAATTSPDTAAASGTPAPQSAAAQESDPATTTTVPKAAPGQPVALAPPSVITATPLTPLPEDAVAAAAAEPDVPVERTQFGLDIGGASSMVGLRALWNGVRNSHPSQFAALRPVLAIRQNKNGFGLQVHVVAGPIPDAAAAAKLCAMLAADNRMCETAIFDGQRLLPDADDVKKPMTTPKSQRRKQQAQNEPAQPAPVQQPAGGNSSMLSFVRGH